MSVEPAARTAGEAFLGRTRLRLVHNPSAMLWCLYLQKQHHNVLSFPCLPGQGYCFRLNRHYDFSTCPLRINLLAGEHNLLENPLS